MPYKRILNRKIRSIVSPKFQSGVPIFFDAFEIAYRYLGVPVGVIFDLMMHGVIKPKGSLGIYRLYFFDKSDLKRAEKWLEERRQHDPSYVKRFISDDLPK